MCIMQYTKVPHRTEPWCVYIGTAWDWAMVCVHRYLTGLDHDVCTQVPCGTGS